MLLLNYTISLTIRLPMKHHLASIPASQFKKTKTSSYFKSPLAKSPKSVHWTRFGERPSGSSRKQLLRKPVEAHPLKVPSNNTSDIHPPRIRLHVLRGCSQELKPLFISLIELSHISRFYANSSLDCLLETPVAICRIYA